MVGITGEIKLWRRCSGKVDIVDVWYCMKKDKYRWVEEGNNIEPLHTGKLMSAITLGG